MKRNVYLVDLGTGSNRNLLPLGCGLIASYAKSIPELDAAFNFHIHFLRGDNREIAASFDDPFVVAFACYTWNFKASLRLAAEVKRRWPACLIVLGGYSVPREWTRVIEFMDAQPYVDILVHGEGEYTFVDLLITMPWDGREDPSALPSVAGITFRTPTAYQTTQRRPRIANLDTLPSPFLNGTFDALMAKHGDQVTGAVWETNRGCPYACTFCDWGDSSVNKVKQFGMERLAAEVGWLGRNRINYIYLADANFGIYYDRDLELARLLAAQCRATGFPKYMAINWLKNSHAKIIEIADTLASGGIVTSVTLAMQSFHQPTLDAIKRKNIKLDSLLKLKALYHDRGLPTYTEMILGLPEETYETFRDGLNKAMTNRLQDHWVFHLCTLLENTEMWTQEYRTKWGIEARTIAAGISRRAASDEDEPETEEIVVGTRSMPNADWCRAYDLGYMTAALFNFRVAFFPMLYAKQVCGTQHTEFVEYVIATVTRLPGFYSQLWRALRHVQRQRDKIMDGIACLSPVDELGGTMALPHEAILAKMLDNPGMLYGEIGSITYMFMGAENSAPNLAVIEDMVVYQKARMPIWFTINRELTQDFLWNVPQYFDALTSGQETPPLVYEQPRVRFTRPDNTVRTRAEFNRARTRAGHTITLNAAEIVEPARTPGNPQSDAGQTHGKCGG